MIVHYINLEESVDRRIDIDSQLKEIGLTDKFIKRFPAIKVSNGNERLSAGEIGCYFSHVKILETLSKDENSIIVEDDVLFAKNFHRNIDEIIKKINPLSWDIIFLCQLGDLNNLNRLLSLAALYEKCVGSGGFVNKRALLNAEKYYFSGLQGYVVNCRSVVKIKGIFSEIMKSGLLRPIDIEYQNLLRAGMLRSFVVFPYLLKPSVNHETTIKIHTGSSEFSDLYNMLGCLYSENRSESDFNALKLHGRSKKQILHLIRSMIDHYLDLAAKRFTLN